MWYHWVHAVYFRGMRIQTLCETCYFQFACCFEQIFYWHCTPGLVRHGEVIKISTAVYRVPPTEVVLGFDSILANPTPISNSLISCFICKISNVIKSYYYTNSDSVKLWDASVERDQKWINIDMNWAIMTCSYEQQRVQNIDGWLILILFWQT